LGLIFEFELGPQKIRALTFGCPQSVVSYTATYIHTACSRELSLQ
jgi:hypothetical protein